MTKAFLLPLRICQELSKNQKRPTLGSIIKRMSKAGLRTLDTCCNSKDSILLVQCYTVILSNDIRPLDLSYVIYLFMTYKQFFVRKMYFISKLFRLVKKAYDTRERKRCRVYFCTTLTQYYFSTTCIHNEGQ